MRLVLGSAVALVGASRPALSQSGALKGTVVAVEGGTPLAHAVVTIPTLGRELFADAEGRFYLAHLPPGAVILRVRRLGYVSTDVAATVSEGTTDSLVVRLTRVALQLAVVNVHAYEECRNPGPPRADDDTAAAGIFAQLLDNAEQLRLLSRSYPFSYLVTSVHGRSRPNEPSRLSSVDRVDTIRYESDDPWRYRPGRIITRHMMRGGGDSLVMHIPTLVDLADSAFVHNHCFHNAGMAMVDSVPMYRLDLRAAARIRSPDVEGSIFLDTATYQIRRTELRLTRMPPDVRGMKSMHVVTDFEETMPSIPIVYRVLARQSFDPRITRDREATFEEQRLIRIWFLGAKPGDKP